MPPTFASALRELKNLDWALQKYKSRKDRGDKRDHLRDAQKKAEVVSYVLAAIAVTNSDLR